MSITASLLDIHLKVSAFTAITCGEKQPLWLDIHLKVSAFTALLTPPEGQIQLDIHLKVSAFTASTLQYVEVQHYILKN